MNNSVLPATSAALDLTHVIYDPSSTTSTLLALVTLSPILLMASYAALSVQTRQVTIILMWAGQLACEAFNYLIKILVKEPRPYPNMGDSYGFPSSHSQWMGYFASFLTCHLIFRHRFSSYGHSLVDRLFGLAVNTGILVWAGAVAYSRYYLRYHTATQILAGLAIGSMFGTTYYIFIEELPTRFPSSLLGQLRSWLVGNPISTWIRLKDGWAVYPDGGQEAEWQMWRKEWESRTQIKSKTA